MHFPRFMRDVNRVVTNPLLGSIAWLLPPMAVVHHVGRKSGRRFRTPVVAFRTAHGFVIPMTYGRDVDWARNLIKGGGGEVVRSGHSVAVRNPRIVGAAAASALLPAGVRTALRAANLPGYMLVDIGLARSARASQGGKARRRN
jgi:deazaflavin-dependent oxidoreductase (nitroreductase family)